MFIAYFVDLNLLPLSSVCRNLIKRKKIKLTNIFSKGDDYQILFTSSIKNRKLIKNISKKMNQKITIIGKINKRFKKNLLLLDNKPINLVNFQGYSHKF